MTKTTMFFIVFVDSIRALNCKGIKYEHQKRDNLIIISDVLKKFPLDFKHGVQ